ncbi:MAG: 3-dehydroquinate synthase [Calditerrivibrio sp.]|nr:3-dehydroquinate synthase [Calditerrivibrio sp.]MCA1933634.1 3-dehydroquinate synthase [Calditerrivibrio sp.]MCA1980723.1 3-dehydroquinate synthase [Calditerrivibrio sp.]
MEKVKVNIPPNDSKSYDILIGSGFVKSELKNLLEETKVHFIVDKNVKGLYPDLFSAETFLIEADEHNKRLPTVEEILKFLKYRNCLRGDIVLAIGGGIVGDIVGFASSIYMRGVKFIQVPTTLLSMVDSSVGGKTGVNLEDVKNLVGSFYQPEKVLIDTLFLDTLSDEEFYSGFAEVIKYSLIFDNELYKFLFDNHMEIKKRDKKMLEFIIKRCCEIKASVVEEDEKEKGVRRLLNLGHTFGHAIEIDSDHKIKHGHAVAKGIYLETLFAKKYGLVAKETTDYVKNIFDLYGYDTSYNILNEERFFLALSSDKKTKSDGIVLALTYNIGSGIIKEGIDLNNIKNFLKVPNE